MKFEKLRNHWKGWETILEDEEDSSEEERESVR